MSSSSANVAGKKYYKQNKDTKMKEPDYFATWWNEDLFSLQNSTRASGNYSFQMCEVEIIMDSSNILEDMLFDMQMGARIYADKDATTFTTLDEPHFDWYRTQEVWSFELEEVAVYNDDDVQAEVEETKSLPSFDASQSAEFADIIAVLQAQLDTYLALLAADTTEAEATSNV